MLGETDPADRTRRLAAEALARCWPLIDRQLSGLGLTTIAALGPRPGHVVVDVGCGAGQTLLQLADRVGPGGQVVGVDIAKPLLDMAKTRIDRLDQVRLVCADAETLDLASASVDGVFSRFGVMGFDDPAATFTNFHRILRPAGTLAFCCWRGFGENALDHFPVRAAGLEAMVDPRPFSFADSGYIDDLLTRSGFNAVDIRAHDEPVSCGGLDETLDVLLSVGALGRILRENAHLRADAEARVRAALASLSSPEIALNAAVWIVTARA